jgi:alkanesulfonate monooxygenase SsuD/methylene tetrahydromethanopterin reductase-like flavin-dependent oxidoreductase (luciferase family)
MGGSSEAAARRAARIGDGFVPSVPEVWDFYRDEVQKLGRPDPGPSIIGANRVVALATDAERGWTEMAPFFRHESNAYGLWQAQEQVASPFRMVSDDEELRASGQYAVLTPEALIRELEDSPFPFTLLHPLCGGMPPELAWTSLRLFEKEVLPAFS